jgi:tRNA(Arg) A34 adenosine deaminase TadA
MQITFESEVIKQALKSKYRHRLGAVVVYRNQVVGVGYNKVYSNEPNLHKLNGLHAEIAALQNTTARYRKGSTIYVYRLTSSNKPALAKPCCACQKIMKKMGVRHVWFSTENGWKRISL